MKRKVWICIVLSFMILTFGCEYSNDKVYNVSKYEQISELVKGKDEYIQDCYEVLSNIKTYDVSFIYVNSETIAETDLNGKTVNTENTIEELQTPFKELKGLRGITTRNNALDFGGWGSISSSIGFIYSPDESITIQDLLPADVSGEIRVIDQDTYFWEQTGGDNSVFFKRITTYYYYYEIWF